MQKKMSKAMARPALKPPSSALPSRRPSPTPHQLIALHDAFSRPLDKTGVIRWAALQILAFLPSNRKDAIAVLNLVNELVEKY